MLGESSSLPPYKQFKDHEELKLLIKSLIVATNTLPYSDTSKTNQNMIYIGFYQGYCFANNWDIDYTFIFSFLSPLPPAAPETTTPKGFDIPINKPATTPNTLYVEPLKPPSGIPDFLKDFDWSKHRN